MQVNHKFWGSFFMPKYKHKEMITMFSDEILEEIYKQKEIQKIPISYVTTVVYIVEQILEHKERKDVDKF